VVYWQTDQDAFATGALWLLGAGIVGAVLAAITGLTDFFGDLCDKIRADFREWTAVRFGKS